MDSTEAREEDPPAIKSADEGRQEAAEISSAILDAAGIRGEVTEPGPGVSDCPGNDRATGNDRLFLMRHPWSIYGLPTAKLEEGLDYRRRAARQGWEIIEDGAADSPNRQPTILFENRTLEYAAHVSIEGRNTDDPRLHVSLVSACFSTPGHESAKNEH